MKALIKTAAALLAAAWLAAAGAQQPQRLTLDPNNAVMQPGDVTSGRAYLTNGPNDPAAASVSLAGLPGGAVYDAFVPPGGGLCLAPQPAPPVPTYALVTGTPIGGMTANGGVAAAFNIPLNTVPAANPYATSARSPAAYSGYLIDGTVGLALAAPAAVVRVLAYSPSDDPWNGALLQTNWQLYGSNVNNFATATAIATGVLPSSPAAGPFAVSIDVAFSNATAYSFYWFAVQGVGIANSYVGQVYLFTRSTPANARGVWAAADGSWRNSVAVASCAGDTGAVALAANDGLYKGSILIDAAGGTATCNVGTYGFDRTCGVWNPSRDAEICLLAGDPSPAQQWPICHPGTPCYVYTPAAYGNTQRPYQVGPVRNNPLIRLRALRGLPLDALAATYNQGYFLNSPTAPAGYWYGIAVDGDPDMDDAPTNRWITANIDSSGATVGHAEGGGQVAEAFGPPGWGITEFAAREGQRAGAVALYGHGNMMLKACFRY